MIMTQPGQRDGQRATGQSTIRDRYPVVRPRDGAADIASERCIATPEITIVVMRLSGSSSWRFEHDNGYMLRVPLVVRDASLLPVADSDEIPPPLVGEVPGCFCRVVGGRSHGRRPAVGVVVAADH